MTLSRKKSQHRKLRKKLLKVLLDKIRNGEFDNSEPLLEEIYSLTKTPREQRGPTRTYVSPTENSSYNTSRYMTIGEIGSGTPNIF